jgi:hypothetical protein
VGVKVYRRGGKNKSSDEAQLDKYSGMLSK